MNKLTRDSLITGLPMPIKLQESCEEIACMQVCEQYVYNSCKGCPVQECMTKLAAYEDTGLEPEEVKHLSASDASKEESSIKYYNEMRKYRDELKYYEDLKEQLLDKYNELKNKIDGDGVENYTNGYKYGHRNGQIELLEWILKIDTGYREEAEKALEDKANE